MPRDSSAEIGDYRQYRHRNQRAQSLSRQGREDKTTTATTTGVTSNDGGDDDDDNQHHDDGEDKQDDPNIAAKTSHDDMARRSLFKSMAASVWNISHTILAEDFDSVEAYSK